jgi:hypothetical protein
MNGWMQMQMQRPVVPLMSGRKCRAAPGQGTTNPCIQSDLDIAEGLWCRQMLSRPACAWWRSINGTVARTCLFREISCLCRPCREARRVECACGRNKAHKGGSACMPGPGEAACWLHLLARACSDAKPFGGGVVRCIREAALSVVPVMGLDEKVWRCSFSLESLPDRYRYGQKYSNSWSLICCRVDNISWLGQIMEAPFLDVAHQDQLSSAGQSCLKLAVSGSCSP